MTKKWVRKVARCTIFFYLFQIFSATVAMAETATPPTQTAISLSSDTLGVSGPISFGVEYDTLEKTIFNAQFVQEINDSVALGFLGEYGINQYRLNATAGFQVYQHGALKLTAEYLSQVLPFDFDSGDSDQRVHQSAVGGRFQHNTNQALLQNVNVGAYWSQAANKTLGTRYFVENDLEYQNQRRIAGATSAGVDLGTSLKLAEKTSLDAAVYFDDVQYDTKFSDESDKDTQQVGGAVKINQVIGDRLKVSAEASNRAIYDTYDVELAYAPEFAQSVGMELIANFQRLISSNDTPNSNTYGLNFSFLGGKSTAVPPYTLAGVADQGELKDWVKTPAVYMDRVLAVAEEITTLAPIIKSVTLNHGPETGGNTVTVLGANLFPGTMIYFGETAANEITYHSWNKITLTVPEAFKPGLVDLKAKALNGKSGFLAKAYTYMALEEQIDPSNAFAPAITSVNPVTGIPAGGTTVTIRGSSLSSATSVTFGGVAATITSNSNTKIVVKSPAGTGTVDIRVTNSTGTSPIVAADKFTYVPAPTITSVSPNGGPLAGGAPITITGTNFTAAGTTVKIGAASATSVVVVNSTTITAVTPSGTAGAKKVSVTTPSGTASLASGYTYEAAPTVTAVTPNGGPIAGGASVTITGTNFTGASGVTFGGTAATSVVVVNATTITAVTPAHALGAVNVVVTTPSGSGTLTNGYTYLAAPTVTAISPNVGPLTGAQTVTITGTNFSSGSTVTIGASAATSVTLVNSTTLTAITPAGTAGVVSVAVTTPSGTGTLSSAYTYEGSPTVVSIAPISGPLTGGQTVTITGTNFTGATAVTLAGVAATGVTVVNSTTITAITPAGTAGLVTVAVTTPSGTGSKSSAYTYQAAPTVTAISPKAGTIAGGQSVTITGTNFIGATAVTLGGTAVSSYTVVNSTTITATTAAHAAGVVDVVVTTPSGTGTFTSGYTYESAPTVTAISPAAGPLTGGQAITITGTNFIAATGVTIGGASATSVTVVNSTTITAVTPTGTAGVKSIVVTTPAGSGTLTNGYTYQSAPTVTSVSPAIGPLAGGQSVTITGTNFTGATNVTFGGVAASSVVVVSSTSITAVTPSGAAGAVTVAVTTPSGTGSLSSGYTYQVSPTVTAISPASGKAAGGNSVTITGTNFTGLTGVTIGGAAATSVVLVNSTTATAVTPAGTAGLASVTVTTSAGSGTLTNGFTYDTTPTVTAVSPSAGGTAGGTSVTITGTGFLTVSGVTGVKFGATNATSYTVNSDTQITAVSPAGTAGTVNVVVTNTTGSGTLTNGFTYDAAPTVTAVSPNVGGSGGGDSVNITGTGFLSATQVQFGGTNASSFIVNSDSSITAITPAHTTGLVAVSVTNPTGTGSLSNAFTYQPSAVVSSVTPSAGPLAGGNTVTITGLYLSTVADPTDVRFGSNNATSYTVNSDSSITAVVPAGSAGPVNVVVTNATGAGTLIGGYTYDTTPTVTSITPVSGGTAGGTSVTVSGTGFLTATAVKFGANNASSFTIISDTSLTATTPAGSAGLVSVSVTNPSGTGTLSNSFTYDAAPTISSLSVSAGPAAGGTSLTITGTGFLSTTQVQFGGTNASSYTIISDTSLTAVTPAHAAGAVNVVVTNATGSGTLTNGFTFDTTPTVTSINPAAGPLAGGTSVTITGTGFLTVSGAAGVKFGSNNATAYTINSDTSITATTSAGAVAGQVNVVITNSTGQGVLTNGFTYDAAPTVTSISPNAGPIAGGTSVAITGTGFLTVSGATGVKFGSTNATSYTVNSDTSITATAPAQAAGVVSVVVTNSTGTGSLSNAFTYDGTPTVLSSSPAAGSITGADIVTITGTGFLTATQVKFGTNNATSFTILSDTSLSATTPSSVSAGAVNITVTNPTGTGTLTNGYTYDGIPTLTSVSPAAGPMTSGNTVTITGTGFLTATQVKFGSTNANTFSVVSDTSITAIVPSASLAGAVTVSVINPTGTGSLTNGYTYDSTPTITSVSPNAGKAAGGDTVTITGTGFLTVSGATGVRFGSTNATSYTVNSDTSITAVAPAGSAGVVDIAVTNSTGTSSLSSADRFTYDTTPTVTNTTPDGGPISGGTDVAISGTGFLTVSGAAGVKFGGVNATSYTVNSDTSITARSPAASAGTVDITVTNSTGTSVTTTADQFTYDGIPTVTSISPIAGTTSGGTSVTLTGTGFYTVTSVKFGASSASFTINDDTSITAVSPAGSAGVVDITVTNATGTSTSSSADRFTYDAAPTISSITPGAGPLTGGATVSITGTGFLTVVDASDLQFDGVNATSYTVNSDTSITAVTPADSSGPADVFVSNDTGSYTLVGGYIYESAPTVSTVSPVSGPIAGGQTITITGTNFTAATGVTVGGVAATSVSVVNSTTITAVTPAGTAGAVTVAVTTPSGTGTKSSAYTYFNLPTVTAITPNGGPIAGGASVTITGTNFTGATGVTIGGVAATSVSVTNSTTITAVTPAHALGAVDVVVTTPGGSGTFTAGYTYQAAPTVTAISPNVGPLAGAQSVTITGTNFLGASGVTIGGTAATSVVVVNSTTITAVTPSGTAGAKNVVVTTPSGSGTFTNGYTYSGVPTVTAITPNGGPIGGGAAVTITGTNLLGATNVSIGGSNATSVVVVNSTTITAVTPAHALGSVDVVVTTPSGTGTLTNGYTYEAAPTISTITANSGPIAGGQTVTITGTNLTGVTSVTFGGTAGTSINVASSTSMTVVTPAHAAGAVNVVVTTASGSATSTNGYTYYNVPTVTAISPNAGPIAGNQAVTLTGTNFTGATGVTIGGVAATSVVVVSGTSITAITPAGTAGTADVVVTTPGGSGTLTSGYTYFNVPTVTAISPNAGPIAGGASVTITGTNFTGATGVTIGGSAATSVTVVNSTTITALTPAHALGATNVVVTTPGGSGTLTNGYLYEAAPTVTSIASNGGPLAGGQSVTITGTNFTAATGVTIGGVAATSVLVTNSTTITAVTPAHAAGAVNVVVTTPSGSGTLTNGYTYYTSPTVTAISPNGGPIAGGASVTITGTNFTGATGVTIGGVAATSVTVVNNTTITATTPAHALGAVDVVVTNPGGSGTFTNGYTYEAAPTITSITANAGPIAGGQSVTINGTNFTGTTAVTLGGVALTGLTVVNSTTITATTPAESAGAKDLVVTTPSGSATLTSGYTYYNVPTLSAISPNGGPISGGASVTLTGTNLTGATVVSMGGVSATGITIVNDTTITATTPAGSLGSANVVVTTPGGTATLTAGYLYEAAPTVSHVDAHGGPVAGGDLITIMGTNFTAVSGVTLAGVPATNVTFVNTNTVTALTPPGTAGAVNVVVTTPSGSGTLTNGYTYYDIPTVSAIVPNGGPTSGGIPVLITGTNLTGTTAVTIGGVAATSVVVVNSTTISAVTPARALGTVDVAVTTPGGTGTFTGGFVYEDAPVISTVSPDAGPIAGGQSVTITGSNFTATSAVNFGSTSASSFTVVNGTTITATTPAGTAG